jgi:hypothetical protein
MQGKDPLDANTTHSDFPNRERLVDAETATLDHHTLEQLGPLLLTFNNSNVHADRIAGIELRHLGFELTLSQRLQQSIHDDTHSCMKIPKRLPNYTIP